MSDKAEPATSTVADAPQGTKKTGIVLVEDHGIVRQGMAALIHAEPDLVVCGEADGVQHALDVIARTHPRLALVDISLKEGDGLELVRQITSRFPDVLTLVLSMHEESVYAERALRAGARGYVRKVEVAQTVMKAIRRVLAGEVYLSDGVAAAVLGRTASGRRAGHGAVGADRLTDRELQVLRCIGQGLSNHEIADALFISVKTVEAHREHMKQKLELASAGDLLRYAIEFNKVGS